MMKTILAAAIATASLAMPGVALADDAMGSGAMRHDASMATMLCRAAKPGEKPTALMVGDDKKPIVCKTVQPDMMMMKDHGPKITRTMSADDVDAAWRSYVQSILLMNGANGGG